MDLEARKVIMKKVALLAAVAGANVFERISRRARVDWKDLIDKVG